LSKFASSSSSTSTNQDPNQFNAPLPKPKIKNYSPIDWKEFFPNQEYVGDVIKIIYNHRLLFIGKVIKDQ